MLQAHRPFIRRYDDICKAQNLYDQCAIYPGRCEWSENDTCVPGNKPFTPSDELPSSAAIEINNAESCNKKEMMGACLIDSKCTWIALPLNQCRSEYYQNQNTPFDPVCGQYNTLDSCKKKNHLISVCEWDDFNNTCAIKKTSVMSGNQNISRACLFKFKKGEFSFITKKECSSVTINLECSWQESSNNACFPINGSSQEDCDGFTNRHGCEFFSSERGDAKCKWITRGLCEKIKRSNPTNFTF